MSPGKGCIFWVEPWPQRQDLVSTMEEAGYEVRLGRPTAEADRPYSEGELVELVRDADALLVGSRERYTRRVLEAAPQLKIVAKLGIGVERIDVQAATQLGILVTNTPIPENYLAVAETTVAFLLALAKQLKLADRHARQGRWRQFTSTFLWQKTVGIVGLGRIGARVAQLLAPLEVRLLAYDPYVSQEQAKKVGAELVSLDALLGESDFVTLHTVTTPETRGLMGEEELRRMKPTAYLINTARGALVDEQALARALREEWIAGAALDVYDPEPPAPNHPLLQEDLYLKTVLSPHAAGITPELNHRMPQVQVENCLAALWGEVPQYVVNPQALVRWRGRRG